MHSFKKGANLLDQGEEVQGAGPWFTWKVQSDFEDLKGAEEGKAQKSDMGSLPCLCAESPTAGPSPQDSIGVYFSEEQV